LDEPFIGEGENFLLLLAAQEIVLGKWWAVIGAIDFLAEEQDVAFGVEGADGLGGAAGGEAATDEDVFKVRGTHGCIFPPSAARAGESRPTLYTRHGAEAFV